MHFCIQQELHKIVYSLKAKTRAIKNKIEETNSIFIVWRKIARRVGRMPVFMYARMHI
jgi:hypothetical protein